MYTNVYADIQVQYHNCWPVKTVRWYCMNGDHADHTECVHVCTSHTSALPPPIVLHVWSFILHSTTVSFVILHIHHVVLHLFNNVNNQQDVT